jgi:hypothetical protein
MEVLVFKTSVETAHSVRRLKPLLDTVAGNDRWNFALDDRDRILRVISASISPQRVIRLLKEQGFNCHELED